MLDLIASATPMPFDQFMEMALYGEGGFFTSGPLRSAESGDFLTSPEVSPYFGRTLAKFVEAEEARLETIVRIVDVGAGSGSLLEALGSVLSRQIAAVEKSPAAREAIEERIEAASVVETLDGVEGGDLVVIANELVDNLPMAVAVRRDGGWNEHFVVSRHGALAVEERRARADVVKWAEAFGGDAGEGELVEVQIEAGLWLQRTLRLVERGAVVVIDYGGTIEELANRRQQGTIRTYRAHHLGPDPLASPGETDITADVNFTALMEVALAGGATVEYLRQDEFLSSLGLRQVLSDLRHQELELARSGQEVARLQVRSEHAGVETLLHPRGLGDFRVLIARKG